MVLGRVLKQRWCALSAPSIDSKPQADLLLLGYFCSQHLIIVALCPWSLQLLNHPQQPQICTASSAGLGSGNGSCSTGRARTSCSRVGRLFFTQTHFPHSHLHTHSLSRSLTHSAGFSSSLLHGLAARPVWVWEQVDRASSSVQLS